MQHLLVASAPGGTQEGSLSLSLSLSPSLSLSTHTHARARTHTHTRLDTEEGDLAELLLEKRQEAAKSVASAYCQPVCRRQGPSDEL